MRQPVAWLQDELAAPGITEARAAGAGFSLCKLMHDPSSEAFSVPMDSERKLPSPVPTRLFRAKPISSETL
jgi:hypothetical protein